MNSKVITLLLVFALAFVAIFAVVKKPGTANPTATPEQATGGSQIPSVDTPKKDTVVKSPFVIKGTVPPGWMVEGVFPIQLLDDKGNIISQVSAHESKPGSWQSGDPISFTASLTFSTTVKSGRVVLLKDNPSGLPKNDATYEIPVTFK